MADQFRELCAELVEDVRYLSNCLRNYEEEGVDPVCLSECEADYHKARAALAQTEPDGPTHVELIAFAWSREPWKTWLQSGGCLESAHCELSDLLMAAITRWGRPTQPAPPAEGEVTNDEIETIGSQWCDFYHAHMGSGEEWRCSRSSLLAFARACIALDRSRRAQPIPVSERLPGPGDRDAEGMCWWFCPPDWIELRSHATAESAFLAGATHWLPYRALPGADKL